MKMKQVLRLSCVNKNMKKNKEKENQSIRLVRFNIFADGTELVLDNNYNEFDWSRSYDLSCSDRYDYQTTCRIQLKSLRFGRSHGTIVSHVTGWHDTSQTPLT